MSGKGRRGWLAMLWGGALCGLGCQSERTGAGTPPPMAPAAGPACVPCSGRALKCSVSGQGGPMPQKLARITGADALGCNGVGDPGLFGAEREPFTFRCDTRQVCVGRANECMTANLTPTGFWSTYPSKPVSLLCETR